MLLPPKTKFKRRSTQHACWMGRMGRMIRGLWDVGAVLQRTMGLWESTTQHAARTAPPAHYFIMKVHSLFAGRLCAVIFQLALSSALSACI